MNGFWWFRVDLEVLCEQLCIRWFGSGLEVVRAVQSIESDGLELVRRCFESSFAKRIWWFGGGPRGSCATKMAKTTTTLKRSRL